MRLLVPGVNEFTSEKVSRVSRHLLHSLFRVLVRTPSSADIGFIEYQPYFYSRVKTRVTPWPTSRTLGYSLSSPNEEGRFDGRALRASLISSKLANKSLHPRAASRGCNREKHHKIGIQYRKRRTGEGVAGERSSGQRRGYVVCVMRMSRGAGFIGTI